MRGASWLQSAARSVVDTIYPPRCMSCTELTDAPSGLCPACWREMSFFSGAVCEMCGVTVHTAGEAGLVICEDCNSRPPAWDRGRAAVAYDGIGRRLVLSLKHADRLDTTRTLASWMLVAGGDLVTPQSLLVPVPLHWRRLLERKYNQSSELCHGIAALSGARAIPDALHRDRATPFLRGMTRDERQAALKDALSVNPARAEALRGADVVLVDDVLTTGSTLNAATQVLRAAGVARVSVLVLARVARPT